MFKTFSQTIFFSQVLSLKLQILLLCVDIFFLLNFEFKIANLKLCVDIFSLNFDFEIANFSLCVYIFFLSNFKFEIVNSLIMCWHFLMIFREKNCSCFSQQSNLSITFANYLLIRVCKETMKIQKYR